MPQIAFHPVKAGHVKIVSPLVAPPHRFGGNVNDCIVAYCDGKEVATLTKLQPCEWLVEMTGARNPGVKFGSYLAAKEAVADFIQQQETH